jgi:hypothetical protein
MSKTEEKKPEQITDIKQLPLCDKIESGELADMWIEVGLTKGPRVSRADVVTFLESIDYTCRTVIWAANAIEAGRACRLLVGGVNLDEWDEKNGKDIDREWVNAKIKEISAPAIDSNYCRYGQHDSYWLGHHLAYDGVPDLDLTEAKLYEPLVRGAGWFFFENETVILSPREAPGLDMEGDLHCDDGPVIWGENSNIYALHGQVLEREYNWIVIDRDTLTREKIDAIDNAEIRSVTIATYPDKYITGEPIQSDAYGKLYDVGEDYRLVEVMDSSHDKPYWLRVESDVETAHAAVASTFGMTPEEYNPTAET